MDPNRWQQIKQVLYEAIELPPENRADFLDEACVDDAALRQEVEVLLDAYGEAAGFMEAAPPLPDFLVERSEESFAQNSDGELSKQIGPYQLVRLIGQGGMGEVFLADRTDGVHEQPVALKLVKHQGAGAVLRRFEAERRILATLQHANIARMLDGGTTKDGRPWFAMEYVDGQSLTVYAKRKGLSIRERILLIREVCMVVHYAHKNLVVHRDLKPSNILVTEEEGRPQIKLLDFGIAKLLEEDIDQTALTESGVRLMTRAYAAPEQVEGAAITTATDVYALGAVFYELLTGRRLFDAPSPHALERAILETDPEAPSIAVLRAGHADNEASLSFGEADSASSWAKKLKGDLDLVCLKALSKEPGGRYASAEAFAADLDRFLKGLPVEARRPTQWYRMRKFVHRHRAGVAVTGLIAFLILGFGYALVRQQSETVRERDRAEQELAKAETVTAFLLDLFGQSQPSESLGDTLTARTLLDRGLERLKDLEDQPEVHALMMDHIGHIYRNLGEYEKAVPLVEQALDERRRLLGPAHEDVAKSLRLLSMIRTDQGNYEEAVGLASEALAIVEQLPGEPHPEVMRNLYQLATLYKHMGQYEASEQRFSQILEGLRNEGEPDVSRIAAVLNNYGRLLDAMRKYDEAYAKYQEAFDIYSELLDADHPDIIYTRNNLGLALYRAGRFDEAVRELQEVVRLRRRVLGDMHPGVASSLTVLGSVKSALEDHTGATEDLNQAIAIYREVFGDEHPNVATVLYNLARVTHKAKNWDLAERSYQESLSIRKKTLGPDHPRTATNELFLGRLLHDQNKLDGAAIHYRSALPVLEKEMGAESKFVHDARAWLAEIE